MTIGHLRIEVATPRRTLAKGCTAAVYIRGAGNVGRGRTPAEAIKRSLWARRDRTAEELAEVDALLGGLTDG